VYLRRMLLLLDDRSVALEMGQSVNAKKVVKINICKESLFILMHLSEECYNIIV